MKSAPDKPSCLILTIGRDSHASGVAEVLTRLEVRPDVLSLSRIPGQRGLTVSFGDDIHLDLNGAALDLESRAPRSVWNRRSPPAIHMPDDAHPADHGFIKRNTREFVQALQVMFEGSSLMVNPLEGKAITSNKLNQLKAAMRHGMRIPRTCVGTDIDQIRAFFPEGRVCMKSFKVGYWRADDAYLTALTTIIDDWSALEARSVAMTPTIFQEYIEKSFEARVTMFGDYHCGTRINNQQFGVAATDWRINRSYLTNLEPISPPEDIIRKSKDVLRCLNLRFGTFDFCITPEGEWVFLEVNEAGQFLWQEEFCPDCLVLEPFARYLAAGEESFRWDPKSASAELSYAAIGPRARSNAVAVYLQDEPYLSDDAQGIIDERSERTVRDTAPSET